MLSQCSKCFILSHLACVHICQMAFGMVQGLYSFRGEHIVVQSGCVTTVTVIVWP